MGEIRMKKEELIKLVQMIMEADGTEDELDRMLFTLERNVLDPNVSNLIFYPEEELTAEQIVEKALAYKPIQL